VTKPGPYPLNTRTALATCAITLIATAASRARRSQR
jgi:hypothetical protein